jgi:serine/threonine protein kinase
MQANRCPSDAELLSLHSSSTSDLVRSEIAKHVDGCAYCQSKLAELNLEIIEKPALADDVTRIWQGTESGQRGLGESETRHDSVGAAASADEGGFEVDSMSESLHGSAVHETIAGNVGVHLRQEDSRRSGPGLHSDSDEIPELDSGSRYRISGEIARGAMGAVLRGRDTDLGRDLAIKVLLDCHKDKPRVVQRFIEEAQIAGQLQHPGIAPVYELGQSADSRPFFSMKLIKGETLATLLSQRTNAEEELGKFLGIFEQVCQTLAYAHSRGVIHRDLKPANIMVGAFGEVQVMDWGLAKVLEPADDSGEQADAKRAIDQSVISTRRGGIDADGEVTAVDSNLEAQTLMGTVLGTPSYMPPEQALGENDNLSERSDVFGLGAILAEILTGEPPYVGASGKEILRLAARGKVEPCFDRLETSHADTEIIQLAKSCLAPEAEERPGDGVELARRMSGYLASVQNRLREAEVERAATATRVQEERKRRRVSYALVVTVFLMVSMSAGGWLYLEQQESARQAVLLEEKVQYAREMERLAEQRDRERVVALDARKRAEEGQREANIQREAAEEVAAFLGGMFQEADPIARTGRAFGAQRQNAGKLTAVEVVQRGRQKLKTSLMNKPKLKAELLDRLGNVFLSLNRMDEAEPLLKEALELRLEHCEKVSPDVAVSMQSLASLAGISGRGSEALELYEKSLAMHRATLDSNDPRLADILLNFAAQRLLMGVDVPQSQQDLQECLAIRKANFPADSIEVAMVMLVLAVSHLERGDVVTGFPLLEKAAAIVDKLQGENGFSDVIAVFSSAILMDKLKATDKARELFQQMEDKSLSLLGKDHPLVAFGQQQFAGFLAKNGERQLAIEKLQQVLRVYRSSFGASNPNVARRLNDLARVQRDERDADAAKASVYEAVSIFDQVEKRYGKATYRANVLHHAISLHILSALEFNDGNEDKGIELIERSSRLLINYASKPGGNPVNEQGRKKMVLHTHATMLLDFDSYEDHRLFYENYGPIGNGDDDVKLARYYIKAAGLQRQRTDTKPASEDQVAVFFEEKAVKLLRSAFDAGFSDASSLENGPAFESIKDRKAFQKLIDEMKLSEKKPL